jgi:glycosyltransferase involved in cell wall biosynthesis
MAGAPEGGAELFYERLCAALARAGDAVLPIMRRDAGGAGRLRQAGLDPVEYAFGGALDLRTRWRVGAALRRFAPRVAVAWMGRAARLTPPGDFVLVGRLGGYYDLRQFAHCDHLVANTQGLADWIKAGGVPAGRVHVLPNFSPDHAGATPAALPTPQGAPVVLAMGRLHRNKGFDVLLAALARLPSVHGVIAGEGPERASLLALARRAGIADRVHFVGWRRDTAALLAACDVLVCASRSEVLGNVILDGFSAGKPVVAAMSAGPMELIESGRTGVLVQVESGVALAAGLAAVLQNPDMARSIAAAGRQVFQTSYCEAAVLARWRAFLGSVEKP